MPSSIKIVAIHNKNGKGLLQNKLMMNEQHAAVAIHNKNGKGLLHETCLI